jgi:hypothetical protein
VILIAIRVKENGIMKAHWDEQDYFLMRRKPLEFAHEDIDLIYLGLAARMRQSMVAVNAGARALAARY